MSFGHHRATETRGTAEQEVASELQPVWENGRFLRYQSFADVKAERAARAERKAGAKGALVGCLGVGYRSG